MIAHVEQKRLKRISARFSVDVIEGQRYTGTFVTGHAAFRNGLGVPAVKMLKSVTHGTASGVPSKGSGGGSCFVSIGMICEMLHRTRAPTQRTHGQRLRTAGRNLKFKDPPESPISSVLMLVTTGIVHLLLFLRLTPIWLWYEKDQAKIRGRQDRFATNPSHPPFALFQHFLSTQFTTSRGIDSLSFFLFPFS